MIIWEWIKRFGLWILAGLLFVVAILAKADPRKWQEKAVSLEEDDVQNDLHQAEIANQKAAVHDQKAHEIKAEAEKEKPSASTSSILGRWRRS